MLLLLCHRYIHVCSRCAEHTALHTACLQVRRSLFIPLSMYYTCMVFIYMINTYIYIYAGFSIKVYISISGSWCNRYAPTCASMCACARLRVCLGAPISRRTLEHFPSAWSVCGSARRRSSRRTRSTRTSTRGTPR
jgi:hypothetical protein